jgi:hypothetical protein
MAKNQDSGNEFQDKIHFTIQGSADMTNVTIVVAVGLFGFQLSIFALLLTSDKSTYFCQIW